MGIEYMECLKYINCLLFFKNFGLSLAEIKHLMQDENAKEYLNILQTKK